MPSKGGGAPVSTEKYVALDKREVQQTRSEEELAAPVNGS
jgi:hypothetical protein